MLIYKPSMTARGRKTKSRKIRLSDKPMGELSYFDDAHRPLHCLVFLLPMVIFYELGSILVAPNLPEAIESRVIAFQLLRQFFALFGATSFYLPGLAVVVILLAWHVAANQPWKLNRWTLLGMTIESMLLAIPLVVFSQVVGQYAAGQVLAAAGEQVLAAAPAPAWPNELLLSIGAGIYEELLFRLILISLLSILLVDLLKTSVHTALVAMVFISAAAFSGYHYLGQEQFTWPSFVFRTCAGVYLAGMFVLRGFGVTVGCHATYDIMALVLNTLHHS